MNAQRLRRYRRFANLHAWVLLLCLAGLLAGVGFLLGGAPFALVAALGVGLLYAVTPRVAPWLLLRTFHARPLSPREAPRLYQAVDTLAARAGLSHRPALFLLPHGGPTAFTTGQGPGAVIALSQGLLRLLDQREVAGVLAHEISHIRHQDTHLMGFAHTLAQATGALAFIGQLLLLISLPILLLNAGWLSLIALLLLTLAPTASGLLHLALSRTREYAADMSAAQLMGSPGPLADALYRLDRHSRSMRRRLPWVLGPRREPPHWLSTHPPTTERIRRLVGTARRPSWRTPVIRRFSEI